MTASLGLAAFLERYRWPAAVAAATPMAIAHRGASDHAPENTLKAFRIASELGAEMWELDVRVSADGVCVVSHDENLSRMADTPLTVASSDYDVLRQVTMPDGENLARLEEVIALAQELGTGLYIELKDEKAGPAVQKALQETGFTFAAIGAFVPEWIAKLRAMNCPYPLAVLVPNDKDPLDYSAPAKPDIIHLCWLGAGERPDERVTDELITAIHRTGAQIVTWHENRAEVIAALQAKPILGICSNRPEVLKRKRRALPQIVCHRGANAFAPENTLPAARICFDQALDFVEIDIRTTSDGHLVVMHDASVDRTTDGQGLVGDLTLADIKALDAGCWFGDLYEGTTVPTFSEFLDYARGRGGVYVEMKHANPSQVLNEVKTHGMLADCFFWCGDTDMLQWMRTQSEEVRLMAARWMYRSVEEARNDYKAQIVEFDVTRDDLGEIAECRALGVQSMIYSQSHDWDDLSSYLAYSPDLVNLDRPDRFKMLSDYAIPS